LNYKTEIIGLVEFWYFKKMITKKSNRFGARLGIYHNQQSPDNDFYRPKGDFNVTSYSVNSFYVGVCKSSFTFQKSGRAAYGRIADIYFDIILPMSKTTADKTYIGSTPIYNTASTRYRFNSGWRYGMQVKLTNGFPYGAYNIGFEFGKEPIPDFSIRSGIFFHLKLGILIPFKI
jgi:hypothetical protein